MPKTFDGYATDLEKIAVAELKKFADTVDTSTPDGNKLAKALTDAISSIVAVQKQIAA